MKKFITLLLVLTGMVSTASANTATIYVKASAAPNIHVWGTGTGGTTTDWGDDGDGLPLMEATNLYGVTVYKYDVTFTSASFSCLFKWGKGGTQSKDKNGINGNAYFKWEGTWSDVSDYDYSVSTVEVKGSINSWGAGQTMTLDEGVYSATIDMSSSIRNEDFKVLVTNAAGDTGWLGYSTNSPTITDAGSLLSQGSDDNFTVANSNKTYKTYNLNVTLTTPTSWSLTFAGAAARETATLAGAKIIASTETLSLSDAGSNTYTGTLNLANYSGNKEFKFNPYTSSESTSIGDDADENTITFVDSESLHSTGGSNNSFVINHASSDYATYNFSAVWDSNNLYDKHWTITITGGTKKQTTAYYEDTYNWNSEGTNVKIYTWTGETKQAGNFGGANMTDTGKTLNSHKVFKWNYAGNAPENVVFNLDNRDDRKTGNLTFKNNAVLNYSGTVSAVAVTIGSAGFATFSSNENLDFTGTGVDAFIASEINENKVVLTKHNKLPKTNGVLLKGSAGTYLIPTTASPDAISTNYLMATVSDTQVAASTSGAYHYFLANGANGVGFYNVASDTYSAAGKAYLETATALTSDASARVAWVFDDESTGIENVKQSVKTNNEYFNIAGQRVAQPTKGLYIVNGKKVIIK